MDLLAAGWKMIDMVTKENASCKCGESFLKYARGEEYAFECMKCHKIFFEPKNGVEQKPTVGKEVVNSVSSA